MSDYLRSNLTPEFRVVDGRWVQARIHEMPGVITVAPTQDEATALLLDALREHLLAGEPREHRCPQHTEHALRAGTGMVGRVFPDPRIDREGRWEFCEIEDAKRHHTGDVPRWLTAIWMTGPCPMSEYGCRVNHLCQHCYENAKVDFDLE